MIQQLTFTKNCFHNLYNFILNNWSPYFEPEAGDEATVFLARLFNWNRGLLLGDDFSFVLRKLESRKLYQVKIYLQCKIEISTSTKTNLYLQSGQDLNQDLNEDTVNQLNTWSSQFKSSGHNNIYNSIYNITQTLLMASSGSCCSESV